MIGTLEGCKEKYAVPSGGSTEEDTQITNVITSVSDHIERYCNNKFTDYVSITKTEYHRGDTSIITLDNSPIINVTSVECSSRHDPLTYTELVVDEDFFINEEDDMLETILGNNFSLSPHPRSIRIVYNSGYATIPPALENVAYEMASYIISEDHKPRKEILNNSVQNSFEPLDNSWPPHIKRDLDLFRNI